MSPSAVQDDHFLAGNVQDALVVSSIPDGTIAFGNGDMSPSSGLSTSGSMSETEAFFSDKSLNGASRTGNSFDGAQTNFFSISLSSHDVPSARNELSDDDDYNSDVDSFFDDAEEWTMKGNMTANTKSLQTKTANAVETKAAPKDIPLQSASAPPKTK